MPTPSTATPTEVTITTEEYIQRKIGGVCEYIVYVNGQEYKELPLDANVREPDTKKSKPYKEMVRTLEETPEKFFENNLGISVVAKQVKENKKKLTMIFTSGTGILNGGHTQRAIVDSQKMQGIEEAIIKITIKVKDYESKRIAEIAAAQNSSTAVKEYSLAEKKGLFSEMKRYMDPNYEKHIIWWEGREVPLNKGLKADDLVAILNCFNIDLYQSNYTDFTAQPTNSSNGKTKAFKRWEDETYHGTYKKIYPLLDDILKLYELIKLKFAEKSKMKTLGVIKDTEGKGKELTFGVEKCTYIIPNQFLLPLLAAYRANIYYDEGNNRIGWYEDNEELFNRCNKQLCERIKSSYGAHGRNVNSVGKDKALWENLYNCVDREIDKAKGVHKEYDI